MFNYRNLATIVSITAVLVLLSGCSETIQSKETGLSDSVVLTVHKRASCGCCGKWVDHATKNGFKAITKNHDDLTDIKKQYQIHPKLASCHTSVTEDGFVFEGHIPAKFIKKFLAEKPEGARGLAVPAMPAGSPGMEYNDIFQPYKVYQLNTDGTIEVYAEVKTAEEQL